MEKAITVCFSGHRTLYDPQAEIESRLEKAVREQIANGAERFICGGAVGIDTIAAQTVLRLKTEFAQVRLMLALPCPPNAQTKKFNAEQKKKYFDILEQADEVNILSESYTQGCMMVRNRFMVDNSTILICYLRVDKGGTYYTVNYARKQGIVLIEL